MKITSLHLLLLKNSVTQIRDEVDIACYLTSIGMVDVSAKMQRSAPPVALINQTIKLKAP